MFAGNSYVHIRWGALMRLVDNTTLPSEELDAIADQIMIPDEYAAEADAELRKLLSLKGK
jgi:hypothetical protein